MGCSSNVGLRLDQHLHDEMCMLVISPLVQVQDGAVSFYLNSELMKQGKTGHTTHRKHVSVWVSDPWNDAVDAKVSNLKIDGGTGN